MPDLCTWFDSKQKCIKRCRDSYKIRIGEPKFNPAGSSRGMSKNYQLVTGCKEN